jgi:hypothetical protein
MPLTLSIFMDDADVAKITSFMEGVEKRTAREVILPILQKHLQTLVDSEKSYLSGRSKSGALVQSLPARVAGGRGDRPNSMTAFSAPTANRKLLESTWRGANARTQQKGWALPKKGRRARVFYAPIVHQGHRIVKRNEDGELYDTGKRTVAVPFAAQAMDSLGESRGEMAAAEIMSRTLGEM